MLEDQEAAIQTVIDNFLLYAPERFRTCLEEVVKLARLGANVINMAPGTGIFRTADIEYLKPDKWELIDGSDCSPVAPSPFELF